VKRSRWREPGSEKIFIIRGGSAPVSSITNTCDAAPVKTLLPFTLLARNNKTGQLLLSTRAAIRCGEFLFQGMMQSILFPSGRRRAGQSASFKKKGFGRVPCTFTGAETRVSPGAWIGANLRQRGPPKRPPLEHPNSWGEAKNMPARKGGSNVAVGTDGLCPKGPPRTVWWFSVSFSVLDPIEGESDEPLGPSEICHIS